MDFNWKNALVGLAGGFMGRPLLPLEMQEFQSEQERRGKLNSLLDLQTKMALEQYEAKKKIPWETIFGGGGETMPSPVQPAQPPSVLDMAQTTPNNWELYNPEVIGGASPVPTNYMPPAEAMEDFNRRPEPTGLSGMQGIQPSGGMSQTGGIPSTSQSDLTGSLFNDYFQKEKKKTKFLKDYGRSLMDAGIDPFQLSETLHPKMSFNDIKSLLEMSDYFAPPIQVGDVSIPARYGEKVFPEIIKNKLNPEGRYETVMEGGQPVNKFFSKNIPATNIAGKKKWESAGHGKEKLVDEYGNIIETRNVPTKPDASERGRRSDQIVRDIRTTAAQIASRVSGMKMEDLFMQKLYPQMFPELQEARKADPYIDELVATLEEYKQEYRDVTGKDWRGDKKEAKPVGNLPIPLTTSHRPLGAGRGQIPIFTE